MTTSGTCGWRRRISLQARSSAATSPLAALSADRAGSGMPPLPLALPGADLRALGDIAAYVENPANLPRIARAAQRAGELAAQLLDDQEVRP